MYWRPPSSALDVVQKSVLEDMERYDGKFYWLKGFAGTGKTVLLLEYLERYLRIHPNAIVTYVSFTYALRDLVATGVKKEFGDRILFLLVSQIHDSGFIFDIAVVDEVQDIRAEDLLKISRVSKKVIFAGDFDQQIFKGGISSRTLINQFNPKIGSLAGVYRLTKKLITLAKIAYPQSNIEEAECKIPLKSGSDVYVKCANGWSEEVQWVWNKAKEVSVNNYPSLILLPRHKLIYQFFSEIARLHGFSLESQSRDYESINSEFESKGVPLRYYGNGIGDLKESDLSPRVYVMTYHSAKGLDFSWVFIPFINDRLEIAWPDLRESIENVDLKLLYVALTRSSYNLYLSYSGTPYSAIQAALSAGVIKEITSSSASQASQSEEDEEDDDDFF